MKVLTYVTDFIKELKGEFGMGSICLNMCTRNVSLVSKAKGMFARLFLSSFNKSGSQDELVSGNPIIMRLECIYSFVKISSQR